MLLLASFVVVALELPQPRETARAQSANMILFFDGVTLPLGWTLVSSGSTQPVGDFYQKFPRGYSSYGGTGGGTTHTHSISWVSSTAASGSNIFERGTSIASNTHTHNSITSSSMNGGTSLPPYRDLKIVKYSGIPSKLKGGLIGMFDTATPSDAYWLRYSAQDGKFIRGETTVGGTGGASVHTHANVSITTGGPSATDGASGASASFPDSSHTHTGSGTTALTNHEPLHVDVRLYILNALSLDWVPEGMIAMFDADPGAGWDVISDSAETYYERFFQGESTYAAGQGNATHTHSNLVITTGTSSSNSACQNFKVNLGFISDTTHTHGIGVSFGSADNLPPYRNVIVAKKKPAVFKSQDWRWYDAEEVEDPANTNGSDSTTGDAIANENTAPTSTRIIYKGNAIKLRFKIAETGGGSKDDVRFRLQFDIDSGFGTAAYVAEQGATGATNTWRYYNGAGTDDAIITNVRLSGSPSAGTHNEAGSAASTFDFAASTTYEFEFTIQLNPAMPVGPPAGTTYYFRAYDARGYAAVPTDGGETYPLLTSSSAFDLEVSQVPANVELGSYTKGGSGTHSYTFVGGEEIVFWDKRGTEVGYSVTAATAGLTGSGDSIPNTDIDWTSATASLNGSFASDTTGMTGADDQSMGSAVTAYGADATEGMGGFYFLPTMDFNDLNNRDTDNYSGTLTITII